MKCFFCNDEIDDEFSEYPSLDSCFNCGRHLCRDCSGSTEKIAGDIRGVFCQYCIDIRDFEVIPIEIEILSQWVNLLDSLLNKVSSESPRNILVNVINDMKELLPKTGGTLI